MKVPNLERRCTRKNKEVHRRFPKMSTDHCPSTKARGCRSEMESKSRRRRVTAGLEMLLVPRKQLGSHSIPPSWQNTTKTTTQVLLVNICSDPASRLVPARRQRYDWGEQASSTRCDLCRSLAPLEPSSPDSICCPAPRFSFQSLDWSWHSKVPRRATYSALKTVCKDIQDFYIREWTGPGASVPLHPSTATTTESECQKNNVDEEEPVNYHQNDYRSLRLLARLGPSRHLTLRD